MTRSTRCTHSAASSTTSPTTSTPGRATPRPCWRAGASELDRVYAGTATHPIGVALADAARRFALPQRHFADLIRGVEMDLSRRRYATFDELEEYCYLVASTVGLLCIEIFGYAAARARADYAVDLGVAFQLTNILRDVREDARARSASTCRCEDLTRFGCDESELLAGRYSARVGALMAFECGRARAYYLRARGSLAAGGPPLARGRGGDALHLRAPARAHRGAPLRRLRRAHRAARATRSVGLAARGLGAGAAPGARR